jgi:Cyclin M transmembrane N-terminal domain
MPCCSGVSIADVSMSQVTGSEACRIIRTRKLELTDRNIAGAAPCLPTSVAFWETGDMNTALMLPLFLVLLALMAFFNLAEMALVAARASALERAKDVAAASKVLDLKRRPGQFLAAIRAGDLITDLLTGAFIVSWIEELIRTGLDLVPGVGGYASAIAGASAFVVVSYLITNGDADCRSIAPTLGPREWQPSFIFRFTPDRRQSPQIAIVGRRDSGRATGDVSSQRSLHRVLCRQFAAPRHVKPFFRASCEERRVTERIKFDS